MENPANLGMKMPLYADGSLKASVDSVEVGVAEAQTSSPTATGGQTETAVIVSIRTAFKTTLLTTIRRRKAPRLPEYGVERAKAA